MTKEQMPEVARQTAHAILSVLEVIRLRESIPVPGLATTLRAPFPVGFIVAVYLTKATEKTKLPLRFIVSDS